MTEDPKQIPKRTPNPDQPRVHFQDEEAQAEDLASQMFRATKHQLDFASESIASIRWLETDGSRTIDDPDQLVVTEFEIQLNNGKRMLLNGPVINLQIFNE